MNPFDILFYLSLGIAALAGVALVLMQILPPTKEPVIGNIEFYFVGQGKKYEAKTSLAEKWISEENFKKIEGLPGFDEDVRKRVQQCFFYAQRSGIGKRLFVSTRNILAPEHHDSFKNVFAFPFGFIDKFRVPCEARDWGKSSSWEIYTVKPLDVRKWYSEKEPPVQGDQTHEELKAYGELAINIASAAKNRAEIKAADNATKAANKRNEELLKKVQELTVQNDELKIQLQSGGSFINRSEVKLRLIVYILGSSSIGLVLSPVLAGYGIAREMSIMLFLILGTAVMLWREK